MTSRHGDHRPRSTPTWRWALARLIVAIACADILAAGPAAAQGAEPPSWRTYIGANESDRPWAGFVRGLGRGHTGLSLSGRDGWVPRAELPAFTAYTAEMAALARSRDLLLQVGGLLAARNAARTRAFMEMIEADQGELWRRTVYGQAMRLAKAVDPDRIYWQVGNEINSWHYARSLRLWSGKGKPSDDADQAFVIPLYAEYFLAPTVAGLNAASREVMGRDDAIPIVLGTIAGAFEARSRAWLGALLDYRLRGDFAPDLAGRRVHELIDIIGIHYLQTHGDAAWSQSLDGLWTQWVGKGRIKGIWATEELGRRQGLTGIGAATAVKTTARCLNFHLDRGIAPRQGRCGLWGGWLGNPGTRGDDAMTLVHEFLDDAPLAVQDAGGALDGTGSLEWHAFATRAGRPRMLIAVYPPYVRLGGTISGLTVAATGAAGGVQARAYRFDRNGRHEIALSVERDEGHYRVRLRPSVSLGEGAALLILVDSETPAAAGGRGNG